MIVEIDNRVAWELLGICVLAWLGLYLFNRNK